MKQGKTSRMDLDVPVTIHQALKQYAGDLKITIQELIIQALLEKLHSLEYEQDSKDAAFAYEKFLKNGSQVISHEEMIKQLGWE